MSLPIIIDTDPGTDDAVALITAKAFSAKVKAFVSTYGNVSYTYTSNNLYTLAKLLNFDATVIFGAKETEKSPFFAEYIHGKNGMAELDFCDYSFVPDNDNFEDKIFDKLKELKSVDYITLGPLTNLASVLKKHPDAKKYINSLTIMGGGFETFNVNNVAEFNIACDRLNADFILKYGLNTTLIPLDLTHKIQIKKDEVEYLTDITFESENYKSDLHEIYTKILRFLYKSDSLEGNIGAIIHDATAVLCYIFPNDFKYIKKGVSVNENAQTVFDENSPEIKIAIDTNREKILSYLKTAFLYTTNS